MFGKGYSSSQSIVLKSSINASKINMTDSQDKLKAIQEESEKVMHELDELLLEKKRLEDQIIEDIESNK
jgi:hypothetical protein